MAEPRNRLKLPISLDDVLRGKFLKELDMTEGRSTGIPKILQAMETNGSPPPMFDFDEDHSYFMCRLPVHPAVTAQAKQKENTGQVTPQVTQQVTQQVGVHDGVQLTDPVTQSPTQLPTQSGAQSGPDRDQVEGQAELDVGTKQALSRHQVEILRNCLTERAITELMKIANRSDRTKFRNQVLNPLLDDGLVEMTQPDSPNSPTQKYRLTQKGFQVLETLSPREER